MAKTKATAKQLRDQTVDELRAKEKELAQQLFALRLNKSTGQLESPARVRAVRRERARVLTVLGERTT
ncbi:MAG TPA: 50S ribosomal protein L29 [Thermoanaerobaculia bacterium]|jgi:large subunit ribosomal protein L29|nr:50S ribosomal protein L29 [Thermoanaerobaculia bacterium]